MTVVRRDSLPKESPLPGQFEEDVVPLRYPKSIIFIVVTEFCERFSYYGMRAVLTIYMRNVLNFTDDLSTTVYHVFLLLCYSLPVLGGILADSFIGKYKTIVYLSSVYCLGNIVLTAASTGPLQLPVVPLSLLGLGLMAIGTGGIKPCVVALGGEQFVLPAQEKILKQFFSIFLFAVSIGNMVATVSTPVLRRDVTCFGADTCYPLAFGAPGVLMLVAIGVFVGGRCLYKIKNPEQNIVVQVVKCSAFAVKEKLRSGASEKKSHWLDYASGRYNENLIRDSKGLFRVLIYYLPVPMFFALYEQLGSRWTLQATRMNGYIGGGYAIKPDQMQVANAILLFIFIPTFETLVYPVFHKWNLLKRPLQKMCVGGVLATLAFTAAGIVETKIHSSYTVLHLNGENYFNFINTISCPFEVQFQQGQLFPDLSRNQTEVNLPRTLDFEILSVPAQQNLISPPIPLMENNVTLHIGLRNNETCLTSGKDKVRLKSWEGQVSLASGLRSIVIAETGGEIIVNVLTSPEEVEKSKEGNAKIRFIVSNFPRLSQASENVAVGIQLLHATEIRYREVLHSNPLSQGKSFVQFTNTFEVDPNTYDVAMIWKNVKGNETHVKLLAEKMSVETGGSYILSIHDSQDGGHKSELLTLTAPNKIHMLWLLPQYVLIAWAEVLFMISGMEFSFTEAPESMKSVVQSCWHLANACGNAIVIISAQFNLVQMYEFFGFSVLMAIDTLILTLMAIRYRYVGQEKKRKELNPESPTNEVESKF